MGVSVPVIAHGGALADLPGGVKGYPLFTGGGTERLDGVERLAHIPPAGGRNVFRNPILEGIAAVEKLLRLAEGTHHRPRRLGRLDRPELKDGAARKNRAIDIKIGIFRRRGDQGDAAILDRFEQRLLLLFIEILDLVEVEQNAAASIKGIPHGQRPP